MCYLPLLQIKMSDIVFLRCWVSVDIPKFYAPVINLLTADKTWSGMRTVAELRRANGETIPVNKVLLLIFVILEQHET